MVIVITTMVSCSTDDTITPIENSPKKLKSSDNSDFSLIARDSTTRDNDTIISSDPVKPRKD